MTELSNFISSEFHTSQIFYFRFFPLSLPYRSLQIVQVMKKLLFLLCSMLPLLGNAETYRAAENPDSDVQTKPFKQTIFWKRHRVEKTCAIVAVSVGGTAYLGGAFFCVVSGLADDHKSMNVFQWISIGGAICSASSVPLFILAHRNAKKARASVKISPSIVTCQPISGSNTSNLTLTLSVNL